VTQFAYDPKGQLTHITDPLGRITTLAYTPVRIPAKAISVPA
jgi:YD repeat-containing protein